MHFHVVINIFYTHRKKHSAVICIFKISVVDFVLPTYRSSLAEVTCTKKKVDLP